MLKFPLKSLLLFGLISFYNSSYSQGCSDAGFCTINSFKPNNTDSTPLTKNQFKTGAFWGNADNSILAYGAYIEFNRQLNNKWSIDLKITSLGQNGNNISAFGLSDAFINANFKANENLKFTIGTKLPFSRANKQIPPNKTMPQFTSSLPMDYQASLGTVDLIFGVGYQFKKIQLAAAIQQPITQNSNTFTPYTISTVGYSELNQFQNTNQFIRSGDVLIRISYPFTLKERLMITPSLLPIYHLANDKYTDFTNIQREIIGSQGLTLNGNLYFDYKLNDKNTIQLNMGMPFIVRKSRPDGLTRSFIMNLEYRFNF
jgi:hypothetical protein